MSTTMAVLALLVPAAAGAYAPRNLGPDVAYVGDAACAQCHSAEARTYRDTAMGRSFALVSDLLSDGSLNLPPDGVSFVHAKSNTRYRIFVEGGVLKHAEIRLDDQGRDAFTDTRPVIYALGSGDRARTFLLQQGDRLYQSPIAYRPHRDGWGMAAGYDVPRQVHFSRNVPGSCLFCHANRASFVQTSTNRYREPVFDGLAIGCERCHGPGALHVAERTNAPLAPAGIEPTIVNPALLPETERDSVCFQCHLQGDMRVVKAEHPLYAFRPGLPLADYFAVFHGRRSSSGGASGGFKVVGHVERLRASRCWKESGARINCLTCHDPHRTPRGEEAVEQFRAACLTCHSTGGPHPAEGFRNCAGCHMAKRPPSDAPHTVFTDHLIARAPETPDGHAESDDEVVVLVNFLEGDRGNPRDAGVASLHFSRYEKDPGPMHAGAALLEPIVSRGVPKGTLDVEALRLLAGYYEKGERPQEARAVLETLVAHAPEQGEFKAPLSQLYLSMGRNERAAALARQSVNEDPHLARAHLALAETLSASKDLAAAETQYRAALACDPALAPAYAGLGAVALARNNAVEAEAAYRAALALDPQSRDARAGLARVFLSRGDVQGALQELRLGIANAASAEHGASIRFMLSAVLASAGRTQEAIVELEKILSEFPAQPDALRLMEELRP